MRVTEKGQVTIPKPIRDKLRIGPGSEVEFVEHEGSVRLVKGVTDEQPEDLDERREWIRGKLEAMSGAIDTNGMDGKAYVDWLRGPRDDVDPL